MWVAANSFKDRGPRLRSQVLCSFGVNAQAKAIVVLELRDHRTPGSAFTQAAREERRPPSLRGSAQGSSEDY